MNTLVFIGVPNDTSFRVLQYSLVLGLSPGSSAVYGTGVYQGTRELSIMITLPYSGELSNRDKWLLSDYILQTEQCCFLVVTRSFMGTARWLGHDASVPVRYAFCQSDEPSKPRTEFRSGQFHITDQEPVGDYFFNEGLYFQLEEAA